MVTAAIRTISANEVSHAIITAAMRVHTELGPGLLESTYTACLQHELRKDGIRSATQVGLPFVYREVKLELGYRMDLVAEELVVVEISPSTPYRQYITLSYFRTLSSVVNPSGCL